MKTMSAMLIDPSPFASHASTHGGASPEANSQLSPKIGVLMFGTEPTPLQTPRMYWFPANWQATNSEP